ncbi:hypothetical protein ETU10_08590 [Apibacter muscae]|uniref:ATP-dependent Clp protease proteolytic subunit n=1 Tax=Apibacter muscae TaxID=2509004 RepID=UPI0011AE0978|nr:ATP-dependent Clp protease proteolytic subunit [Apibacter muscae]TWP23143.1 hypothetical protein ETU10_08590 [Apibacter muscae]
MAFEIKIYGGISDYQSENTFTLKDLQRRLEEYNGEPDVLVRIKTDGGYVNEGFAIYGELRRFAKEKSIKITTRADGFVASIGTVIFLAGDKRILNPYILPFIHEAYSPMGEDSEFVNESLAKFYTEHTLMSEQQARELMQQETYIPLDQALDMKFGTEVDEVYKPEFLNKIMRKMEEKNNKETWLKKRFNAFTKAFKANNKIEFDASNNELLFSEVQESEEVKIGDTASYNGEPAKGEVTMSDGTIYVFENGALKEIKKNSAEPEPKDPPIETDPKDTKIQELEKQLNKEKEEKEILIKDLQKFKNEAERSSKILNKFTELESSMADEQAKKDKYEGGSINYLEKLKNLNI